MSPRDLVRLLSYAKPYRVRLAVRVALTDDRGRACSGGSSGGRDADRRRLRPRDSQHTEPVRLASRPVFAAQAGFSFLRTYLLSYTGERIVADVRTQLYNHLTNLPVSFFANRRVGELTSRLASDVSVVQTVTTGSITELLRSGLLLVGGITIIFVTNVAVVAADARDCSGCDRVGAFVWTVRSPPEHSGAGSPRRCELGPRRDALGHTHRPIVRSRGVRTRAISRQDSGFVEARREARGCKRRVYRIHHPGRLQRHRRGSVVRKPYGYLRPDDRGRFDQVRAVYVLRWRDQLAE